MYFGNSKNCCKTEKKSCDCCGIEIDDAPVQITIDQDTFNLINNIRNVFFNEDTDNSMPVKDLVHFAVSGFENSMVSSINRGQGAREFLNEIMEPVENIHLKKRLN